MVANYGIADFANSAVIIEIMQRIAFQVPFFHFASGKLQNTTIRAKPGFIHERSE